MLSVHSEGVPRFVTICELLKSWAWGGCKRTWRIESGSKERGLKIAEVKAASSSTLASSRESESHSRRARKRGEGRRRETLWPLPASTGPLGYNSCPVLDMHDNSEHQHFLCRLFSSQRDEASIPQQSYVMCRAKRACESPSPWP